MALKTLEGVTEINGEHLLQGRIMKEDGSIDWDATDEARKTKPIFVDHSVNMISFRIQNGPVKENGKNGCQVEDILCVAMYMIGELNKKFPCNENTNMLEHLTHAINWSKIRTQNRIDRNVEGKSQN